MISGHCSVASTHSPRRNVSQISIPTERSGASRYFKANSQFNWSEAGRKSPFQFGVASDERRHGILPQRSSARLSYQITIRARFGCATASTEAGRRHPHAWPCISADLLSEPRPPSAALSALFNHYVSNIQNLTIYLTFESIKFAPTQVVLMKHFLLVGARCYPI